jgi:hypothetical protein
LSKFADHRQQKLVARLRGFFIISPPVRGHCEGEARRHLSSSRNVRPPASRLERAVFDLNVSVFPWGCASTHAISNRSVVQRYRENGVDGCRFASASPSAFAESHRTCLGSLPIALVSSVPFAGLGGARILVGWHRPIGSIACMRKRGCRPGTASPRADRNTGRSRWRCSQTMHVGRQGDTASR